MLRLDPSFLQPIQLFRPYRHWEDKPLSIYCSNGLGYTLVHQDTELSYNVVWEVHRNALHY